MVKKPKIIGKNCIRCDQYRSGSGYYEVKSMFFPDGHLTICKVCLKTMVDPKSVSSMDRFCQWSGFPFYVDKWMKLAQSLGRDALDTYISSYCNVGEFESVDWSTVNEEWIRLQEKGKLETVIPDYSETEMAELRKIWGNDYEDSELMYMQDFYRNLEKSHNMITELQKDAARNIAKLSIRISQKISGNDDVDKDIRSYNELMKSGGFTVESAKNLSDFESIGEVTAYLERTGWENKYYRNVPKDVVDTTIANMQAYLKRIVLGEVNLREQAEEKLAALGIADNLEDTISESEFERYESEGYQDFQDAVADVEDEDEELNL